MSTETTDNLLLPYIMAAQAQKHVTHNEAIRTLDALVQLSVADRALAPPRGPIDWRPLHRAVRGERGVDRPDEQDRRLAGRRMGHPDTESRLAVLYVFDGAAWITATSSASINPAPLVGVNTMADTTNRQPCRQVERGAAVARRCHARHGRHARRFEQVRNGTHGVLPVPDGLLRPCRVRTCRRRRLPAEGERQRRRLDGCPLRQGLQWPDRDWDE